MHANSRESILIVEFDFLLFFFSSRRRHTRYIGDWSSDVCSSDLRPTKDESRKRSADERSDDPQDHGAEPAHRVRAGHKRSCDEARDQPDDQENEETPKVHAHTSVFVTGLASAATVPSPEAAGSVGGRTPEANRTPVYGSGGRRSIR